MIEPEEFDRSVEIEEEKNLCCGVVFVIWKWAWEDTPEQNESSSDDDSSLSKTDDESGNRESE